MQFFLSHMPCRHARLCRPLLLIALLSGCVHQHYPASEQHATEPLVGQPEGPLDLDWHGPAPQLAALSTPLKPENTSSFKRKASDWLSGNMRNNDLDHYQVEHLGFISSGNNGQPHNEVRVRFYQGDTSEPAPLVVIMPIWGSYDYPAEKLAWKLRDHYQGKVHLLLLIGEDRLLDWAGMAGAQNREELEFYADKSARQVAVTVRDVRGLLRWAEQNPLIDPDQISFAGFSMGAVLGSMVVAHETNLANALLVMGAANPAEVLASCNRIAGRTRKEVSERLALGADDYASIMEDAFGELNLALYGGFAQPERVLVLDAKDDDCMPPASREALWKAMNYPERYTIDGTHEGAFLTMTVLGFNFTSNLIVDHLTGRIDEAMTERAEPKELIAREEDVPAVKTADVPITSQVESTGGG